MKKINIKRILVACVCVFTLSVGGAVAAEYVRETPTLTANAEDLGVITLKTHTGNNSWLASTNRILFQLPSEVPATNYSIESGTISLTRGGTTYTRDQSSGFTIQSGDYEQDAFIEVWHFGNELGVTYAHEAGDKFVINGTFTNGTDSFTIEDATIIVNSSTTGDMYVEEPAINAGYGGYVAEWSNAWAGNYYPQMYIATNAAISAGTYKQVNADAITLTRNGTVYNLPVGDYLTVGGDNGGTQQFDFTLWPLGNALGVSYTAQAGDILTVDGKFTNGTVTFEVQKTEITNLADKACTHSVVPVYTVNYTDENGDVTGSVEARHNTTLTAPSDPVKEESGWVHEFDGWYNGDTKWDFTTAVTSDMTLTPKFNSYIDAGAGRAYDATTGNETWSQANTGVLFSMDTNAVPTWTAYTPTTVGAIKIIRGETIYNGNSSATGNQYEVITKRNDNTYIINVSSWTFGTDGVQDGDIIVIDGIFTEAAPASYGTTLFKIEKTVISISIDDSGAVSASVSNEIYTATFEYDGATYATQSVVSGEKLTEPEQPTKEADSEYTYEFDGWYNGTEKWDFANDTVTGNVTLAAVFNAKAKEVIEAGYGYNENITTESTGFYFKMYENAVPYNSDWSVRYIPMSVDAIKRIRDGATTNVGNTAGETIVKYGANEYYVEAWAVGGWQDGDVFVFDGKFQNATNGTIFSIKETYVKVTVNADGSHTDSVLNPTVTFVNEDGTQISKETIAYNSLISVPATTPTKAEDDENTYAFAGWYNGDEKWNFPTDIPNGDITLTAKFNAVSKYTTYNVENVTFAADKEAQGFYFYANTNDAPYSTEWNLRYIPTSADAIVKISADGTTTNVGNTGAETIVKFGENAYYVEAWAIGGYEDGATYVLNGTFKNAANMTNIVFENIRIKLSITDGNTTANVLREPFSMVDGAAIRLNTQDGKMGIRFEAEIGYTYDENATYHMMIVPVSYLKAFNITDNYYTELVAALAAAGKNFTVATMQCEPFQYTAEELAENGRNAGSYYIRGSLTTIKYENINVEFIGIAYKVKDGVYTYVEVDYENNARSLAEVASKALNDTATYPNGNTYLENFVKNAFAQAESVTEGNDYTMPASFALSTTTLEGYPVNTQLSISGIPAGADVTVLWSSSDSSIVAVDEKGNVIGMSSGTATITASFLGVEYTCTVTNMAGAKPVIKKDGALISWSQLANVETYSVSIVNEYGESVYAGTVNGTCVDLSKLGLISGNKYVLSVRAIVGDAVSSASKFTFTYEDWSSIAYIMPEEAEELSVGVWNGSYHFNDHNKIKELADARINLIIGINPVWQESTDSWIAVLDKAYEYGVSIIADPRGYADGDYTEWDGTLPEYGKHPAITGFIAFDEPFEEDIPELTAVQEAFNTAKAELGREDLLFFVNVLGASASAGLAGDSKYDYQTEYVDAFMDAVEAEVISFDEYGILKNGDTANIRKSYYQSFDSLAVEARDNGLPFWYTLLSSGHNAGDEGDYVYSEPTEAELRWQMAVGMAFGAKNLTHYTYTSSQEDYSTMVENTTWNTTELYDRIKKVNAEYTNWATIYNSYTWQGYAALDFGETTNSVLGYKANALMQYLSNNESIDAYGGLKSLVMSDGSSSTASANNAKDLLVGMFEDDGGNLAFMLTNAASAVNKYSTASKYYANLAYSMVDIGITLTFESGYAGVIVIDGGVKTYHELTNDQLTLTVGAWEGVFVIPVKAKTQLSAVTNLAEDKGVITWDRVSGADAYDVVVTYNGEEIINTTVMDTSFTMDRLLGDYTITVYARSDGQRIKSEGTTI